MKTRDKRIGRLRAAIQGTPVRRQVLREAYEWFRDFGELPEDDAHVAYEVVQQALRGGEELPDHDEAQVADRIRSAKLGYAQCDRPSETWPPSVRGMLFDEALFGHPTLQKVARAAIACEVAWGGEVENPAFCARFGMPGYGSVAMHVLGRDASLARPPYEDQAQRLFVRRDNLRGRPGSQDSGWSDEQAKAIVAFWQTGALPQDDLQLEALLVHVEFELLVQHKRGMDVAEAMALLDSVTRGREEEQVAALRKLCEMAAAGQLPASRRSR
jgi:hypothetical protein